MIRLFLLLIFVLTIFIALFHCDQDAYTIHLTESCYHINTSQWLGTDVLGRDVFARLLIATKYSLIVAFSAGILTVCIGSIIGVISAFNPGFFDQLNTYLFEVLMSIPYIPLMMIIMGIQLSDMNMGYDFSLTFYIFILAIISWPPTMKIMRGKIIALKQEDFVRSAYAMGVTRKQFIWDVLFRNLVPTLKLQFSIIFGQFLIIESVLSYLGLGIQSPYISLGTLIQEYQTVFIAHPNLLLYPCGIIFSLIYMAHFLSRR